MELIDKQDLTRRWRKLCEGECADCHYYDGISDMCGMIENTKVVDPVKHGKWERVSPAHIYECSVCHKCVMTDDIDVYEYCHRCGAKMDLEDEG